MKRLLLAMVIAGAGCFDLGHPLPDGSFPVGGDNLSTGDLLSPQRGDKPDDGGASQGGGGKNPGKSPRFSELQASWEAAGCSTAGGCHDSAERTIVVWYQPDEVEILDNWSQIAPPEAGGESVNAAGCVNHFNGRPDAGLWRAWQEAGYPYVE